MAFLKGFSLLYILSSQFSWVKGAVLGLQGHNLSAGLVSLCSQHLGLGWGGVSRVMCPLNKRISRKMCPLNERVSRVMCPLDE